MLVAGLHVQALKKKKKDKQDESLILPSRIRQPLRGYFNTAGVRNYILCSPSPHGHYLK